MNSIRTFIVTLVILDSVFSPESKPGLIKFLGFLSRFFQISIFQFLLKIEMSRLNLTKIVTILPYFLVVNDTAYSLRYMEDNEQADLWIDISPNEVRGNTLRLINALLFWLFRTSV